MRAYSMDLRERALLDSDAGMKAADVAAKYRVSGSWVRLLKQRRRETGEVAPRVQRHGRRGMLEPHSPATTRPAATRGGYADAKDTTATHLTPSMNPRAGRLTDDRGQRRSDRDPGPLERGPAARPPQRQPRHAPRPGPARRLPA